MEYKHLFSPIEINGLMIKNRIVAAPVSETYEEKALGGAGIVVAGHAIVEYGKSSYASPTEPDIFSKYEVEQTRQRILKIHQAGAKASIEIFHAGQYARVIDYAKGPTGFIREDGVEVKEMDEVMMQETIQCFYETAKNAKDLGFDMLFMHFGHGWLPAEFLSPLFNKRTDEYGGSFENRIKFPLKILETVRKAVGKSFPIDMRISAFEWVEGSIEFDEVKEFIKMAQKYIDTVQISAGLDIEIKGNVHMATTTFEKHMPNVEWANQVKKEVSIPVSVVGAVLSPEEADMLIESGKVDMVAFGRAFIADPYWPKKVLENKRDAIAPCIRCMQCYHISTNRRNVGCSVNPRYTNESFVPRELSQATNKKRVVVIGGGPAGMQASVIASQRGHDVILLEKSTSLGGQLTVVEKEYFKEDISRFLKYLRTQVNKSTVEVRTNTKATPQMVKDLNPDVVIIGVGAKENRLPIEGSQMPHVLLATEAIQAEKSLGNEIVVIGGGTIGSEIALEQSLILGKRVHIVEIGDKLAPQGNTLYREGLRQKIEQAKNLSVHLKSNVLRIGETFVEIKNEVGDIIQVNCENVILSTGLTSKKELAHSFYGITPETIMIGDCNRPRNIMDAVFEGYTIGMNI